VGPGVDELDVPRPQGQEICEGLLQGSMQAEEGGNRQLHFLSH
jgi:hypothetical protein